MQFFFVVFLCFLVVSVSGTDHSAEDLKEFLLHHNHVHRHRHHRHKHPRSLPAQCGRPMVERVGRLCMNCVVINGFDDPHEGLKEVCCRQQKCTDQFVTDSVCCSRFKKYEQFF
ncbi:hypothetical protein QR680_008350 [Steinernema hermaphroditum]|uniref:Uncharacterized protein n=1 Tax=Steinernema hermaphroditum TaxID=289476 RepID=A0AA39IHN7_9BILA|nr:hypothetical protein QR680_008350 [Steinernema hermaphroditum]